MVETNYGAPAGAVMHFAMPTAPQGWLECDGSEVSIKEYCALYQAIGDIYGKANCPDMFKLPDLRGEFIRSYDKSATIDEKREFGSKQGDAIRNINGKFSGMNGILGPLNNYAGAFAFEDKGFDSKDAYRNANQTWGVSFDASRVVPTAQDNRPKNSALLACIKY